ncbi:NAD(P)/FAD-dependent oxidoreductase [Arthrobacter sp. A2-55]|uniref:NAD(P)/FAD-dependent oxidoreductase n=1 Tax=Arthrobacter sp. A2-55 TaxID=2897337 RepID=UPI0021CD5362|nr:FAD-dependent oxidoreductase [Arthrobacter sp. A2-55]MCU6479029.1 NAD(P)-binding protein [Arthrobacter sp. A2-55]
MTDTTMTDHGNELPVAIIGAGPIGLATAANLIERGLTPLVFESGDHVGAAIRAWGHIRLFSPWRHNIDPASRRLLEPTGWTEPRFTSLPYGAELAEQYLEPLAAVPAIQAALHLSSTVTAVSRAGMDKTHSRGRDGRPFLVRVATADGTVADHQVRAVIDASGTWAQPNPLGQAGLLAPGEAEAIAAGLITGPLPDVTGAGRARFTGRHVLVIGAGHSAANTLLALGQLAKNEPGTRVSWAVRGSDASRLYGGGDLDGLPARGQLGTRLRGLVEAGHIELHTSFTTTSFTTTGEGLAVTGTTPGGDVTLDVDLLIPATGFRPDLDILREIRLELDPAVEAPRELGPLIDPEFHSCGTVPAHGAKVLAHPEKDFYIAGMKSYGRAPTFLLATGYEQVRSIVAALAGDQEAADQVQLELPETGVCSTDLGGSCDTPTGTGRDGSAVSCCAAPEPVLIGFPTGLVHGRSATTD